MPRYNILRYRRGATSKSKPLEASSSGSSQLAGKGRKAAKLVEISKKQVPDENCEADKTPLEDSLPKNILSNSQVYNRNEEFAKHHSGASSLPCDDLSSSLKPSLPRKSNGTPVKESGITLILPNDDEARKKLSLYFMAQNFKKLHKSENDLGSLEKPSCSGASDSNPPKESDNSVIVPKDVARKRVPVYTETFLPQKLYQTENDHREKEVAGDSSVTRECQPVDSFKQRLSARLIDGESGKSPLITFTLNPQTNIVQPDSLPKSTNSATATKNTSTESDFVPRLNTRPSNEQSMLGKSVSSESDIETVQKVTPVVIGYLELENYHFEEIVASLESKGLESSSSRADNVMDISSSNVQEQIEHSEQLLDDKNDSFNNQLKNRGISGTQDSSLTECCKVKVTPGQTVEITYKKYKVKLTLEANMEIEEDLETMFSKDRSDLGREDLRTCFIPLMEDDDKPTDVWLDVKLQEVQPTYSPVKPNDPEDSSTEQRDVPLTESDSNIEMASEKDEVAPLSGDDNSMTFQQPTSNTDSNTNDRLPSVDFLIQEYLNEPTDKMEEEEERIKMLYSI